jgi:hypothetical protein
MRLLLQPDQYQNYPSQTYPGQAYPGTDPGILHHMSLSLQESVYRVLALLVSLLPGLLAFILAVGLLSLIGMGLSWVLRKILVASKFDERLARNRASGIADWAPSHSPTALVGRVTFWTCVILGLVVGIYSLDVSYSATGSLLSASLLPYLTHAVGAILLLFFGNLIARFLARTVLIGAVNNGFTYARFLSMGVKWLVLVLTAAMVLDHLQIGGAIIELAFGILFGGIVLTLALAIGLGSRDLVSRSLDKVTDRPPANPNDASAFEPPVVRAHNETLRHF